MADGAEDAFRDQIAPSAIAVQRVVGLVFGQQPKVRVAAFRANVDHVHADLGQPLR